MGSQYSFQKPTQFSQGNNVLDAPPSNVDYFLSRDAYVSSIQLKMSTWKKVRVSPP
jgi:hypothetical protein